MAPLNHNALSDDELDIYSRQIVFSDIGYDGQLRLKNAKICLVGVGGLGSPTALKLTGMGIGLLRIVDRDIVSRSDLHRQHLYDTKSVGRPKVEVAMEKLSRLNPNVTIEPVPESLNKLNAIALIDGMDMVIDGLDAPQARYLVNRTCHKLGIPYIFGAAIESYGQVSTLVPGRTFCLECFMPGLKDDALPTCGNIGIHPSVLGIVSAIQVAEAVRLITRREPLLLNKLFNVDLQEYDFRLLAIAPDPTCKVCGAMHENAPEAITDRYFEETCARDGRRNFVVSPKTRIRIEPSKINSAIKENNYMVESEGPMGVTFAAPNNITACLLISGIMIAQIPPQADSNGKTQVLNIYKQLLVDSLGFPGRNLLS